MANDVPLITIEYNHKEGGIDFTIPSDKDDYLRQFKAEIIEMFDRLKSRMLNNEYPFHLYKGVCSHCEKPFPKKDDFLPVEHPAADGEKFCSTECVEAWLIRPDAI